MAKTRGVVAEREITGPNGDRYIYRMRTNGSVIFNLKEEGSNRLFHQTWKKKAPAKTFKLLEFTESSDAEFLRKLNKK